jgi:hypothetical protein
MAITVNEEKTIVLIDGTEIKARPLKISLLRDFMNKIDKLSEVADDNDKSINVLLECVQIALKQYKPELAADAAVLEEILDLPTIYRIVEEASGVKLGEQALLAV